MNQAEILRAFSAPRFQRYVSACQGDWEKAVALYQANIRLSSRILAVLCMFEVTLRNAIDAYYTNPARFGSDWLLHQSGPFGFLAEKGCEKSRQSVLDIIQKLGKDYSHDQTVAMLGFAFWRCLFASKEFAAAGSSLLAIFPARPHGGSTNHTYLYKRLNIINDVRNRIAHHDPLCFTADNTISVYRPLLAHQIVCEVLEWLGFVPADLLQGIDFVKEECQALEALYKHPPSEPGA